jgi:hypothetical protein
MSATRHECHAADTARKKVYPRASYSSAGFAAASPPDVRRGCALPLGLSFTAASPPDVRRGCALPLGLKANGLCLWFGLCPRMILGQRPYQGPSPTSFLHCNGGAVPRLTSGGEAVAKPGLSAVERRRATGEPRKKARYRGTEDNGALPRNRRKRCATGALKKTVRWRWPSHSERHLEPG